MLQGHNSCDHSSSQHWAAAARLTIEIHEKGEETQSLLQLKSRGSWMGQGIWDELVKEGSKGLRVGGMKVYQKSLTTVSSVHTLQIYPMEMEEAWVSHVSAVPPLPALLRVLAAVSSAACQRFHSVMGPCTRIRGKTQNIKSTQPPMPVQFARETRDFCLCAVIKMLACIHPRAEKAISSPPSCPSIKDDFIMLQRGVVQKSTRTQH